jgi:ATP phosphoribosyltransferase regulatory subunit
MRTLEHPLPSGMRDLLPPETIARRAIARAFLGRAEMFGYEPIIPPAFEYAETIERGLGTLDPREIVRFVEPETGEVVALRPDVTPQIARLVATRLSSRPGPYRLAYDASVLRRRAGSRARTHRQIPQIGVELIGVDGPDGDLELLVLAVTSLQSMGLGAFSIDLGHAEIVRSLLVRASPSEAAAIADALASKDVARLSSACASLDPHLREAIVALPNAHGPTSVLDALPSALWNSPAAPSIVALRELVDRLSRALHDGGVESARIAIDLGEVRGHAYYTGPFFQILAEGPGAAIGGGGRYDGLLARFGRTLPATGLALDVDALTWALRVVGSPLLRAPRRCVVVEGEGAVAFADRVRARGIPAVVVREVDADAFARAWAYDVVVQLRGDRAQVRAPGDVVGRTFGVDEGLDELARATAP